MSFAAHSGTTCATEQLNVEPRPPRQSHTRMVWGLFKGGVYFEYGMHQIHVHVLQNKGYRVIYQHYMYLGIVCMD